MPENAPLTKIQACRKLGADMRLVGDTLEAVPPDAHTIADGIKVKRPGVLTRQVIARHVDDNAIAEAIVTLLECTRTIGEGAGVVGLAAKALGTGLSIAHSERFAGVVLSTTSSARSERNSDVWERT